MKEEWKEIEGYPDYEISNHGRVKSHKRFPSIILKQTLNRGYPFILLYNKKRITIDIHVLVWEHFGSNIYRPNRHKLVIDHIDENPGNNRIDNLRIIPSGRNTRRGYPKKNKRDLPVGICRRDGGYIAYIRREYLGCFKTPTEAIKARQKREIEVNW